MAEGSGRVGAVFSSAWGNLLKEIIASCGDDLIRSRIMDKATHLKNVTVPMLLPGVALITAPTDYRAVKQLQLKRFDGAKYVRLGDVISAD